MFDEDAPKPTARVAFTLFHREQEMKIQVECYSGHKADERPIKFWLGDLVLFVETVEDQWYGPDDIYFRVVADDGNIYVLGHNEHNDDWTLESFRSKDSPGQPAVEPPSKVQ